MKVYSLRPWRPLRHTACATSPALAGEALGYNGIIASPVATGEVASTASRWGRLWLAFISDTMKVYGLRSWRPLRHTACATSPASAGEAGNTLRPLTGFLLLSFPRRYGEVASTASRWGRLCLACTSVAMEGLQLAFMAPPPPLWQGRLEIRSVPLRGFPYLSFPRRYGGSGEQREPIGALVACIHF